MKRVIWGGEGRVRSLVVIRHEIALNRRQPVRSRKGEDEWEIQVKQK